MLQSLRDELRTGRGPVVIFNKSHSGSRFLARLVRESGVFMGAHVNESNDSLDVLRLVEHLVTRYYPDYGPLWDARAPADPELAGLVRDVFAAHLEGFDRGGGGAWGWKLCETVYILPVLDALFPAARYIHLIRDGRDVAFCDHTRPRDDFWKKVYFNTHRIESWRGLKMTRRDYQRRSHIYNALHWVNSVQLGRAYGAMLRERCLEVRYEDLCLRFDATAARVLEFIGAGARPDVIERLRPEVRADSVGKHRDQPRRKVAQVLEVAKPLLLALGYLDADPGAD